MDTHITRKMLIDAKMLVARLEEEIAKNELVEPSFLMATPNVITFVKRFGRTSGKFYNYAAIGLRKDVWYLTGRRNADSEVGMSWRRLVEFMEHDETEHSRPMVLDSFATWTKDQN